MPSQSEIDAGQPEAGSVHLGGRGQLGRRRPQPGQAVRATPLEHTLHERVATLDLCAGQA